MKYGGGGLSVSSEEINFWQQARPHIAEYSRDGQIWINPENGEPLSACPWLQLSANNARYSCAIYHDRPAECRQYPTEITEMAQDGCEMLEARDLKDPDGALKKLRFINT